MHRGLTLAHGGRLQTPRLDHVHGRTWEATFFAGAGFTAELPVHHHLNQGPFIKALAERYQRSGPLPDMLWTALGWMQTGTTFDEVRFLTAMTALEAIIESELPARHGAIISKSGFKPLRQKLETVIETDDSLSVEAKRVFLNKVSGLNQTVLTPKNSPSL